MLDTNNGGTLNARLENNVFAQNFAEVSGGALTATTANASSINLTLTNNTIVNNLARVSFGDGIALYTGNASAIEAIIKNSIFMNTGSDLYLWAAPTNPLTVNASYSMYGNVENQNDNATFTGSNNLVYVDPLLDTAYNQTAASPGINKGICGIMSIGGYNRIAPYKDINGDSRPGYGQYLGCDIGADEYVFPWMLFNHLYK